MNVQQLIDQLLLIDDKSLEVVYVTPDGFIAIKSIDISDMFNVVALSNGVYRPINKYKNGF